MGEGELLSLTSPGVMQTADRNLEWRNERPRRSRAACSPKAEKQAQVSGHFLRIQNLGPMDHSVGCWVVGDERYNHLGLELLVVYFNQALAALAWSFCGVVQSQLWHSLSDRRTFCRTRPPCYHAGG